MKCADATASGRAGPSSPHLSPSHNPPVLPSDPQHHHLYLHHHLHHHPVPTSLPQLQVWAAGPRPSRTPPGGHQKVPEFLAVSDRGEALSSEKHNGVALSGRALPLAPHWAVVGSSTPLPSSPWDQRGCRTHVEEVTSKARGPPMRQRDPSASWVCPPLPSTSSYPSPLRKVG
ncbi:hypothetical protein JZ751_008010, partial [Albula glossodonta]